MPYIFKYGGTEIRVPKMDEVTQKGTAYIHIKFAPTDTPTSSEISDIPNIYMGIYSDNNSVASTNPDDYKWIKIKGETGETGSVGTGIENQEMEYYLSSSKTQQSGGSWSTTPPTMRSGYYLWRRFKITLKNPTSVIYTTPFVDTSWEVITAKFG